MVVPNDHTLIAYLGYFFAFVKDADRVWRAQEEHGRWYIYDDQDTLIAGPLGKKQTDVFMALSRVIQNDAFVVSLEGALENGDTEQAYLLLKSSLEDDNG